MGIMNVKYYWTYDMNWSQILNGTETEIRVMVIESSVPNGIMFLPPVVSETLSVL